MFCIKAELKPSPLHGMGVFSKEFIRKGDIVWKFEVGMDVKIHSDKIKTLTDGQKYHIMKFFWKSGDYFYSSCDISNYVNHSNNPNTAIKNIGEEDEKIVMEALKDIQEGEELTQDYGLIGDYDIRLEDNVHFSEKDIDPNHYNFLYK
jgi:SET domain-containing protein